MIGLHLPAGTKIVCVKQCFDSFRHSFPGLIPQVGGVYTLDGYRESQRKPGLIMCFLAEETTTAGRGRASYSIGFFDVAQTLPASILECLNARPKRVNKRQREDA